jgi:hypothetical protein
MGIGIVTIHHAFTGTDKDMAIHEAHLICMVGFKLFQGGNSLYTFCWAISVIGEMFVSHGDKMVTKNTK